MSHFQQQPFQQQPFQQPQHNAPKKKHTGRNIFLAIVGVLVVTGIAASFSGSPSGTPSATETTLPNVVTTTDAPVAQPTEAPTVKVTQKPVGKKWVKLTALSGSADKSSDTVTTTGGKVRISYTFKDTSGYDMVGGAVYFLDEGVDLMSDGGIPEVNISHAGKDSTTIRKAAGAYYVKVMVANARYTVTVEEER
jgi:hypothetical protein